MAATGVWNGGGGTASDCCRVGRWRDPEHAFTEIANPESVALSPLSTTDAMPMMPARSGAEEAIF